MLLFMCLNVLYPEETLGEEFANPQAASSAAVWLEAHSLDMKVAFAMFTLHSKNAFPVGNAGRMQEMQKGFLSCHQMIWWVCVIISLQYLFSLEIKAII